MKLGKAAGLKERNVQAKSDGTRTIIAIVEFRGRMMGSLSSRYSSTKLLDNDSAGERREGPDRGEKEMSLLECTKGS